MKWWDVVQLVMCRLAQLVKPLPRIRHIVGSIPNITPLFLYIRLVSPALAYYKNGPARLVWCSIANNLLQIGYNILAKK